MGKSRYDKQAGGGTAVRIRQDVRGLTDNPPFPWQEALYKRFVEGEFPQSCNLPTGLGKTMVIAIWLIALAYAPKKVPRRLVYVVNRRTVVDQSTREAEKLRGKLVEPETNELINLAQ